ncbi:hypothetical protein AO726_00285 [Pseudomonas sp. TTU2014-080ASC]|nr:hypothetical protein AO726_00285 [Pseudomonas sp. TTU2014-080ASC]
MPLIRLILIALLLSALSVQSMAGVRMVVQGGNCASASAHEGHHQDSLPTASGCAAQADMAHQHGGHLCALCVFCPAGVALTSSLNLAVPFIPVSQLTAWSFAVRSTVPGLADKPPKYLLV